MADLSRHFIIIEVFIGIVVCTLIGSDKWIYSIPLIAITFIFLYYWTISYTKKIFLKLYSNFCWLGYGNKGLVINGDEFSFGTEEQFITFIKNKNHININLE